VVLIPHEEVGCLYPKYIAEAAQEDVEVKGKLGNEEGDLEQAPVRGCFGRGRFVCITHRGHEKQWDFQLVTEPEVVVLSSLSLI
jgi:hypothetical protein